MNLSQISRRDFILLSLQLIALSQLPGCRSSRPVLGRDPMKTPLVVEDHSQLLAHWAEKGVRDAVLINIDTHDDIRWMQENKIDALRDIYRKKDWQSFRAAGSRSDNGLYHIGNWIYAGGRLGMFSEVYWVIPFNVLSMQDPDAKMRRFLKDYEFNDQEIQSFTLRDRQFRGSFHGVPLTICDIRSLPDIGAPVLLSMDTDFFPPYSDANEKSYLPSLHDVFQALHGKRYQVLDAAVCYSVHGYFLPPHLRWVGDTIGTILEKPGMIDEQPTEMLNLLQQVDNDYRGTDAKEMLRYIESWQGKYPAASLQAYTALAHTLRNDPENAYRAAVESCNRDRRYCDLLPYIGTYYYNWGEYSAAERFFVAGFAVNPGMANGLFEYGHCLRRTGRVKEAIAWYERDEAANGIFPTRFLIAESHLLLRDRQAAKDSLARAVEGLTKNRYAQVVNRETARAIYTALDFCDREGLKELSGALSSNPAVIRMFTTYPKKSLL